MVRRDEVNYAIAQPLPKSLAVFAAANRRGTFVLCGAVGDLFGGQMNIVRTGFRSDGKDAVVRRAQFFECAGR